MPRRPILFIPDPRLKQVAAPVVKIDDAVKALAAEMFETMYEAPGIGLAAPQIGVMKRSDHDRYCQGRNGAARTDGPYQPRDHLVVNGNQGQ